MFEKKEIEKFTVTITGTQYLTLAYLLKAASQEIDRFAITRVVYDHDRDQFVATDGHLLRVEKLEWLDEPPQSSFFLSRKDLMLSQSQIMLSYGAEQHAELLEQVLIDLEYMRYEDYPEHPYPNYSAVLPQEDERRPLEWIGLSPDLLKRMGRTFFVLPKGIRFQFKGDLAAVSMYDASGAEEQGKFLGVLMPIRVMGETPAPLFELKEIERKAPKEDAAPTPEDLGQQNLVEQAAQGPVEE
jgi:hypothetical protein